MLQVMRTRLKGVICNRNIHYVQGQEPAPKVREYFYFIDHQGMLFLDDARIKNFTSCFKEVKFLRFFFTRLKKNDGTRYADDFPYLSLCGNERNYVRCDDFPFVYTHVFTNDENQLRFAYGHAGDSLSVSFEPEKIFMSPASGRVYHPAPERVGSVGLVRSQLAIEFSKYFEFENGEFNPPTKFTWNDKMYHLDNEWYLKYMKGK